METKKALTTSEAAQFLAELGTPFSPGTLEVWRHNGRGPRYRKVCRKVVYHPRDLEQFAQGELVETIDSRNL